MCALKFHYLCCIEYFLRLYKMYNFDTCLVISMYMFNFTLKLSNLHFLNFRAMVLLLSGTSNRTYEKIYDRPVTRTLKFHDGCYERS